MKPAHRHFLAASLLATLGAAAMAQAPQAAGPGAAPSYPQGRFDPARMQERMAQRLAELKLKLQLAPAQDAAWNSYATAMKLPAHSRRPDHAALDSLSTPDRIDHMRVLRNDRIAEMDRRGDATKAFYAVLTPEQKKAFDAETAALGHRRHHGHGDRAAS